MAGLDDRKSTQPADIDAPATTVTITRDDIAATIALWKVITSEEHRKVRRSLKQRRPRGRPRNPNLTQDRKDIAKDYANLVADGMKQGLTRRKATKSAREKVMESGISRSKFYLVMKESKNI